MKKEKILGFDICTCNEEELLNNIFADYEKQKQLFIVNVNPEIAVANYKNEELKNIFNKQKYQIPDGTGIVWASKKKNGKIKTRITGIDFMLKICKKSQDYCAKIYLYGSKENIATKAKKEIEKKYKNINIVGTCDGYKDESYAIEDIINSKADIVFVGLGSPKQEQFIIDNMEKLKNVKILMPVGGSFDVISNTKKRAPKWMIKLNIEWLYRLFQEPKRILRQIKILKFIFLVMGEKDEKN